MKIFRIDHFQTSLQDLNSKFGYDLRRQMLHKLANNGAELSPDDPEKHKTLLEKYKQYQVSVIISLLIIFQSVICVHLFHRKRRSIGLVYYRMKHWINSKKQKMKTMKNLFVHGKNYFVNHSLLNSPDDKETMNPSIWHRLLPNRMS